MWMDRKVRWSLATQMDIPHRKVRRLDMTAEPFGVEQRAREPIPRELVADRLKQDRFGGELERERFVFLEITGDEFRQPCGMEQARRHPARKGGSRTGQQRQPRP